METEFVLILPALILPALIVSIIASLIKASSTVTFPDVMLNDKILSLVKLPFTNVFI